MQTTYRLFGIEDYTKVIEDIMTQHELESSRFAVELILTEVLSNAYKYGNLMDASKSIDIHAVTEVYETHKALNIQVQDEGEGIGSLDTSYDPEEHFYDESGRGMFLIRQLADTVEIDDNRINIYKCLQEEHV